MNRTRVLWLGSITMLILALAQASANAAAARRTLKVKLNYTGAGIVDGKHQIFVLLFDANPYTASGLIDSTSSATPPAPAPGVSHILRRESASGAAKAISLEEGKTQRVSLAFDDSIRTPQFGDHCWGRWAYGCAASCLLGMYPVRVSTSFRESAALPATAFSCACRALRAPTST